MFKIVNILFYVSYRHREIVERFKITKLVSKRYRTMTFIGRGRHAVRVRIVSRRSNNHSRSCGVFFFSFYLFHRPKRLFDPAMRSGRLFPFVSECTRVVRIFCKTTRLKNITHLNALAAVVTRVSRFGLNSSIFLFFSPTSSWIGRRSRATLFRPVTGRKIIIFRFLPLTANNR